MSDETPRKTKQSFWTTIRIGWRPYKRLYSYAMPYKFRFIMGLAFGFLYGAITSCLPLVMAKVTNVAFGGHAIAPTALASHPELMAHGPKINSLVLFCLAIPAVMTLRSLCSYANTYYVAWVSNKVLTDIRTELFGKMVNHSMEFFNKAQSGFLMSRITNDTRMMQAALSSISSDLFKQPVAIVGGVGVLLYMDWKFTIVTLVLFPSCLIPLAMYGKKARKAVVNEQYGLAQMVVTMQETFAGIRVIKSFAREGHQQTLFQRSNDTQFSSAMRILRATE
ncbi:MAG: ABC transporter transmembrane domain-containing protein, partial [Chthoniobacterales bacterium]